VTTPACGATPSLLCTSANLVTPDAASTFFYADGAHPTTAGHAVIAQAVESMLEGPAQIGALAEAPLAVEKATFRAIDGRMFSSVNAPRATNRFDAWVSYDYGHNDIDGRSLSGNADVNTIVAGGDMKVSDRMLIGVAFSYADNKGDFGATSGGYKLKEATGTVYAGYGDGPWYVGATLGAGDLDFSDVHRNIQLGALSRTETGETRGWQVMGSVLGGYWLRTTTGCTGPLRACPIRKSTSADFRSAAATAPRFRTASRSATRSSQASAGRWRGALPTCVRSPASHGKWKPRTTIAACRPRR
jgi:outer membrane lipase/esterase